MAGRRPTQTTLDFLWGSADAQAEAVDHERVRAPGDEALETLAAQRYSQLEDPVTFFELLGQEVSQRVTDLSKDLEGTAPPGESYLDKVGRLNMARHIAVSEAMRELVLIDPEPGADPDGLEEQESDAPSGNSRLPSN